MGVIRTSVEPCPLDNTTAPEETDVVDEREDTQVTSLYANMSRKLLRSSLRMDATCIKAEKFRRLARNRPQKTVQNLRARLSQCPPGVPKGDK